MVPKLEARRNNGDEQWATFTRNLYLTQPPFFWLVELALDNCLSLLKFTPLIG